MKYVPGAQANNTKKSLGQHWLHDTYILNAIVEAAEVTEGDNVLEVGPGLGTLTQTLVDKGAVITALEFDQDLVPKLRNKFANCDNVAIIEGDVRTFDYTKMQKNYKIVANIPYYLTSNLIRSISETSNSPSIAVLLIQKEVAQRICAKPGQMGILSVTAQLYFECFLDIEVPAELFTPAPKVDSQVVKLVRREIKLFEVDDIKYVNLVKAGFSEKRKTLRNSLSGGLGMSKEEVEKLLIKSELSSTARAQELSLEEWYKLYLAYYETQHGAF
jgi:16S rRNA (adenine1518-N6/adenine1519-N6)-dimethyltransferase